MISKSGILVVILVDSHSFVLNNSEDLLRHSNLLCSFIFSLKFALLYVLVLRIRPRPVHFRVLSEQCTTFLLPFYQGHPTASQGCCISLHQVPKVSKRPISGFHSFTSILSLTSSGPPASALVRNKLNNIFLHGSKELLSFQLLRSINHP